MKKMAVIYVGQVRMANLAIVGGYSVNGVARLHTEILEKRELKDFYEMMPRSQQQDERHYPETFPSPRQSSAGGLGDRSCGRRLGDQSFQAVRAWLFTRMMRRPRQEFLNIKYQNKVRLARYIQEHNGIEVESPVYLRCAGKETS